MTTHIFVSGIPYVFLEAAPAKNGTTDYWAFVLAPNGEEIMVDNCWPTKAAGEQGGREYCDQLNAPIDHTEIAMEAGMLHGIDAYNEALG